jgi:predicted amidohydrolase
MALREKSVARRLEILGVQAAPHAIGAPFADFAAEARAAMAAHPATDVLVFPEMHLFHGDEAALRTAGVPIDGPLDRALAELAAELGVVLVPGTLVEAGEGGTVYNTARVYGRDGAVLATYRKVFPWRPTEPFDPGADWVTFDLPQGRVGLTICYDAWYPEATRQVAWMGAEVVLNLVKTTTADRPQELVLARANAIVNQLFMVSLNCAGPVGKGYSVVADPEGHVVAETGAEAQLLPVSIDLDEVARVRREGTCGENRLWAQFRPGEAPIALPAYAGRIDPADWNPDTRA